MTRDMVAARQAAYVEFHAAYYDRLLRYLLVVTAGDEEWMREALQATFRRVAKNIRVFHAEEVFWSWLTAVARSAAIDERRIAHRYRSVIDRFSRDPTTHSTASDNHTALLKELLEKNLAALSPTDRAILEAKYFDRISVREIASRMQISEGAVESRLVRLRQKLKAALIANLKEDAGA